MANPTTFGKLSDGTHFVFATDRGRGFWKTGPTLASDDNGQPAGPFSADLPVYLVDYRTAERIDEIANDHYTRAFAQLDGLEHIDGNTAAGIATETAAIVRDRLIALLG